MRRDSAGLWVAQGLVLKAMWMLRQWIETADYEDVKATLEKVLDNFENGILYLDCVPAEHK